MSGGFEGIGSEALCALADALDDDRVAPPYGMLSIRRFVQPEATQTVACELAALAERGFSPHHIAHTLRLLANERGNALRTTERVELVWSGPEVPGASSRDTSVVIRELFESAQRSIVVAGYAVYQGRRVFRSLAENVDAAPGLRARMFFNIHRGQRDDRADSELVREFAERFKSEQWPGQRLPELFYDPRALSRGPGPRACLHAKCVVVDEEVALVTSANFTEAAHERNIEAGVLVKSSTFALALVTQFESLIQTGAIRRLAGLGAA